jgi:hypothetical protein
MLAEEGVMFVKTCEHGLEEIVSKRDSSFYKGERSRNSGISVTDYGQITQITVTVYSIPKFLCLS